MIQSSLQSSERKRPLAKSTSKPKVTDEVRRAKAKTAATMRAEFNWRVAMERIDFNIDVLEPAIREVEAGAARGELPEFTIEG